MDIFKKYNEKYEKIRNERSYCILILNLLQSMIKFSNLEKLNKNVSPEYIMIKLLLDGRVCFFKNDNVIEIADSCTFSGIQTNDIVPENITVIKNDNVSKYIENWKESKEVAVIKLNPLYYPDFNIIKFAKIFNETDISMKIAVVNSRLNRIIKAKNSKEKTQLDLLLDKAYSGVPTSIVDDNIFSTELENGIDNQIITLSEPENVKNLQYLTMFYQDLKNRLFNIYGIKTTGVDKLAQQSVEEINNGNASSFILPLLYFNSINDSVEKLNEKFDANWKVELNEILKREIEKFNKN